MLPRTMLLCAALLVLPPVTTAQERPQPHRWRGLVLDEASPGDAIRILGKPVSDKPDRLFVQNIDRWFVKGLNKKTLRKMQFKGVEGFDKADLYFVDDKLAVIQLDFKKEIAPNALANIYGLEFRPYVSGFDESASPRDYEQHAGRVYPKSYPIFYNMVAVSERAILSADVHNSGVGSVLRKSAGIKDGEGGLPGKVSKIQLISRRLENREGADNLK